MIETAFGEASMLRRKTKKDGQQKKPRDSRLGQSGEKPAKLDGTLSAAELRRLLKAEFREEIDPHVKGKPSADEGRHSVLSDCDDFFEEGMLLYKKYRKK